MWRVLLSRGGPPRLVSRVVTRFGAGSRAGGQPRKMDELASALLTREVASHSGRLLFCVRAGVWNMRLYRLGIAF